MTLIEIARLFLFVREIPENKGQRVEAIQRWSGGAPGDSWCAFFVSMVLDLYDQGKSPLLRTGSCDNILHAARTNRWLTPTPIPGDLYLYVRNTNDAYHVGIVTAMNGDGTFRGISGNTSADGLSANGDRVAERDITLDPTKHVFVRVPRPA
jgi:hypothetical protein